MDVLRMTGVSYSTYKMRMRRGWPLTLALLIPVAQYSPVKVDPDLMTELEVVIQKNNRGMPPEHE